METRVLIYGDFDNCGSSQAALEKLKTYKIPYKAIPISLEEFREGKSKKVNALKGTHSSASGDTHSTIPIIYTPTFLKGGNDALTDQKLFMLKKKFRSRSQFRSRSRSKSRPKSRPKSMSKSRSKTRSKKKRRH